MARSRDVKNVVVHGSPWTGVQEVSTPYEAESFDNSGDADEFINRVDVTKQSFTISINIIDPQHKRDIYQPQFGASPGIALNEVMQITAAEEADEIVDSAEDDEWLVYTGVTKRALTAEVEMRDISQLLTAGTLKIGDRNDLIFKILLGAVTSGLANRSTWEQFTLGDMTVTGINPSAKHGDLASGTVTLRGNGNQAKIVSVLSAGGETVFNKHVGEVGTISWTAPSVGGSGGDKDISIANCVLTSMEIVAQHGGRVERRFGFRAFSSDGITSPLTIS